MERAPVTMPLEILWEHLLSRQPDLVIAAFQGLAEDEQEEVLAHLNMMSVEPGWHPEQRISALTALAALGSIPDD
jgi:hypothetical protein